MRGVEDLQRLEAACHSLGKLLEDLAQVRARGAISDATFVDLVLKVEEEQLSPHGLTLTATDTADGWTVFHIRTKGVPEACAAFQFLPTTGEFRRACEGSA